MTNQEAGIPTPEKQKEIIQEIEKKSLVLDEILSPISFEWYEKWKCLVGYDEGAEPTHVEIPPINNSKIIKNGRLLNDIGEDIEYCLLRKQSYDYLQEWYSGDKPIEMKVIPDKQGQPTVVKRYITVEVNYKADKKNIEIHKLMKISDVHKIVREEFNIPEDLKTCLRIYMNHAVGSELKDEKYVDDYTIITNMQLLLDYLENDKWNSTTLKAEFKTNSLQSASSNVSSSNRSQAGIVGFNNLGNTCFFNSGTQCLMHTVPLMQFMLSGKWKADLNETNPIGMKGYLAKTFAALANDVWSGKYGSIAPRDLKHIVGKFAPQFSGWGQQDSHELILFTLDGIHEDLNRCKKKPIVEPVEGDGTDDEEKAKEAWLRHKLRNDSIIVDLFHGQIRSRILCPDCQSITVVFDPYMSVPMPIQRPHTKKIKLTYVPFNFFEERKTFKVEFSSSSKDPSESVSKSISEILHKNVKVQIGVRSYVESPIKWGLQNTQYSSAVIYAYEIPEEEDALFIPCVVKLSPKVRSYYGSPTAKTSIPFLVDVHDLPDNFDEDEEGKSQFEKKIEERLSCIWNPEFQVEENDTIKAFAEKIDPSPPKDVKFKDPSEKMEISLKSNKTSYSIYSRSQEKKESIKTKSEANSNFVNAQATIVINPESENFSLVRLLSNIEQGDDDDSSNQKKNNTDSITLDTCFEYFSLDEKLDANNQWYCPKCKKFVCANKKLDIWKVPQVLVIQLKRFTGGRWTSKKLDQYVDFPEIIDMKKYVVGPQRNEEKLNYRLFAVSNHMGGLGGGHYTACANVKDPIDQENKGWYYFNDSSASQTSESNAHSSSAYVLFYERLE